MVLPPETAEVGKIGAGCRAIGKTGADSDCKMDVVGKMDKTGAETGTDCETGAEMDTDCKMSAERVAACKMGAETGAACEMGAETGADC